MQRIDPYRGGRRFILDHCPFDPSPAHRKPEEIARDEINERLAEAGWVVQSRDEVNLSAGRC